MDIHLYDKNFDLKHIFSNYISFIWTDRYSALGDFTLVLPYDGSILHLLETNRTYIRILDSTTLMVLEKITIEEKDGLPSISLTGRSLSKLFSDRIIWDTVRLKGNIVDCLSALVSESMINPKDTNRAYPGMSISVSNTSGIISEINEQISYKALSDPILKYCEESQIGFRINFNPFTKETEVVFYDGVDRSLDQNSVPPVIFGPSFGNIRSTKYLESSEKFRNVALVAGAGEDTDRKKVVIGTGSGFDRYEAFIDARDVQNKYKDSNDQEVIIPDSTYLPMLEKRGKDKMSKEFGYIRSFDGELDTSVQYEFGNDYFLGDIVQVQTLSGMNLKARVSEHILSVDDKGKSEYPTFDYYTE